jgi:hypothetical protein
LWTAYRDAVAEDREHRADRNGDRAHRPDVNEDGHAKGGGDLRRHRSAEARNDRSASKNAGEPTLKRVTQAGSFLMFLSSSSRCDVRRAIA